MIDIDDGFEAINREYERAMEAASLKDGEEYIKARNEARKAFAKAVNEGCEDRTAAGRYHNEVIKAGEEYIKAWDEVWAKCVKDREVALHHGTLEDVREECIKMEAEAWEMHEKALEEAMEKCNEALK